MKIMERMITANRFAVHMVALVAVVMLCLSAGSRVYAGEDELPCAKEIAQYCRDVKPGGGRILNCLGEHQKELSESCQKKLGESKKRLMQAQQACSGDVEKFCKEVKPGEGRILKCLDGHEQELSSACRQGIDTLKRKVQERQQPAQ